ncbi:ABC transporter ATP-binding protein [Clostridium sp. C105KSO13]|uniref:ABC transporter ATP-binding protein n=1 Tax=Clostridium sp. C105KSO13 TaxID=1776045 RepID=UPI0007407A19|nr:ABC transporter ATP-binding protein [Clostridium sp. C105KSO13]CUX51360.1 Oligopeptide transport ATP-binding protein OppF [Clostridium sp. C105KSO13]
MNSEKKQPVLRTRALCKNFKVGRGQYLKAVDNINLDIYPGEIVSLVGESGCGKSTFGRCIVRLTKPTSGDIEFEGKPVIHLTANEAYKYTRNMQMIFQNPYASLDPRMTVKEIVAEGLEGSNRNKEARVVELLETVGLNRDHISRFPHEFSGGQRQRIGIARALSVNPKFIVCDEPISALDVSIQAQVINMLKDLQRDRELTYLFIAHDLSVVKYISDRVVVMYLGNMVETAMAEELYANPLHPYTKGLLSSIPVADPRIARNRERIHMKGEVLSPINPPECCRFVERCPYAKKQCWEEQPLLKKVAKDHLVACHLF